MIRAAIPATAIAIALGGCAATPVPPDPGAAIAPAWQAPLPHGGRLVELDKWWAQFDDPLMARLVTAAEAVSPSIASASARIAEARATRVGAEAALLPQVNATASASRGRPDLALPLATASNAGLQASWELDVFGGNRAGRSAAEARLAGAEATWHDARVIVAAETANQYLALRACQARLVQTQLDATSRAGSSMRTRPRRASSTRSRPPTAMARVARMRPFAINVSLVVPPPMSTLSSVALWPRESATAPEPCAESWHSM